ncbi:phytanoyl-CoA dioxygenase family protein [Pseudoalteromonas haloplanktis]|uniref:Phytanoyl-CoA dioxygenase family protein n=1 Tax=Pseudoalteromonas haloplanktis TaxID=228 RepID=A0ABU1BH28_PSEHA|nr:MULTISPECIES: phytanoyl-CoA dioxygenase family protein [Pseudoalteromonas]MDQ9093577.1 phytanoyl-CoA dioxygenase family protein [Pseudoalteromonas haloplanktis]BDF94622.1 L-proline 4-hydroxylase [Pseudoalteromonas sp. KAN5]
MNNRQLTPQQIADFHRDGYVIAKGYYDEQEIARLQHTAFNDDSLYERAWHKKDADGAVSKVCLWQKTGDDFYSMFSRGRRLVDVCEKLIGEEVYHTSTKIMMKEPFVGGAWEWHQDFGYWHRDNYMLYPKAISCMVAINKATVENGCLQVLKGSHHLGRLDHSKTGDQKGACLEFVEEAMKYHELVNVELEPGDVLFFHCNLLHKSNQNRAAEPRWSMICAFNAITNQSFKENEAVYYPLEPVNDDAILNWKPA